MNRNIKTHYIVPIDLIQKSQDLLKSIIIEKVDKIAELFKIPKDVYQEDLNDLSAAIVYSRSESIGFRIGMRLSFKGIITEETYEAAENGEKYYPDKPI